MSSFKYGNKKLRKRYRTGFSQVKRSCFYCGVTLSKSQLSLDHVIPRSKGGDWDLTNCVPSCKPCNVSKGDRMPTQEEWENAMYFIALVLVLGSSD